MDMLFVSENMDICQIIWRLQINIQSAIMLLWTYQNNKNEQQNQQALSMPKSRKEMLKGLLAKLSLQITPKLIKKQSNTLTHQQVGNISSLFPKRQLLQQCQKKPKTKNLQQIQKSFQLNSLNFRKSNTIKKDLENVRKQMSSVLLKIKAQEQSKGEYRYIRTQANELGAEFDIYLNPNKIFLKKLVNPNEKVIGIQFAARNQSWPVSPPKRPIQSKKDEYREIKKLDNMGQLLQRHHNLMKKFTRLKKPKTEKLVNIKKYSQY